MLAYPDLKKYDLGFLKNIGTGLRRFRRSIKKGHWDFWKHFSAGMDYRGGMPVTLLLKKDHFLMGVKGA